MIRRTYLHEYHMIFWTNYDVGIAVQYGTKYGTNTMTYVRNRTNWITFQTYVCTYVAEQSYNASAVVLIIEKNLFVNIVCHRGSSLRENNIMSNENKEDKFKKNNNNNTAYGQ